IEWLKSVLADEWKIMEIIKEELTEVKRKFGDERRTNITHDMSEIDIEDMIADDDVVISITHRNYIKRIKLDTYRRQNRGGTGVNGMPTKEDDFVENLLITTNHHTILFYTNKGRVYYLKAYQIAEASRTAKGTALINLLKLDKDEKVSAVIQVRDYDPDKYLFMATKMGVVKRVSLSDFNTSRKIGVIAISLQEDDELIGVKITNGQQKIMLGTKNGMAIAFEEDQVRVMGRVARGVKGIRLTPGDEVVAMDSLKEDADVLTITECGLGKRTTIDQYTVQHRGGKGLINLKVTEKTGKVIGMAVVQEDHELLLITEGGVVLRTSISGISQIGRNTQGVIIMKPSEGDKVSSMATLLQKND
ncbi:MAG TPA: DNA gyrase subunit A, partial [Anaerovibrio sp.]|nr:DNA gyrase subunit A [Anaerovibrio sp.]